MLKAIAYIGVSTDRQAKNNLSLKGQQEQIEKYAKTLGYELVKVFEDAGESAKTTNRPEFLKAIDYALNRKNTVSFFIVWKFDRFARHANDHLQTKAILQKNGVRLLSVTENLIEDATGDLMELILAGFAQFDNAIRGARSAEGAKRRLEKGGWPYLCAVGL